MQTQGLVHVLDNIKRESESEEGWKQQQHNAYSILMLSLDEARVEMMMEVEEGDAYGVWKILVKHYERQTNASKSHTRRMLHSTRMIEGEEFDSYHTRVMQSAIKLRAMGEKVTDGELIYVIVEGLPASFAQLKSSLYMQDDFTVVKICEHARDYQERIVSSKEEKVGEDVAMLARRMTSMNSGDGSCHICRKRDHWANDCPKRKGSGDDCYRCGGDDHRAIDCKKNQQDRSNKNRSNYAVREEDNDDDSWGY